MFTIFRIAVAALIAAAPGAATYLGSVVSSFYVPPLFWGGWYCYPTGLAYGSGFVWVFYMLPRLMTKREPVTGSLISSFQLTNYGSTFGWDATRWRLYAEMSTTCRWFDATTGSLLGSFPTYGGINRGCDYDEGAPSKPLWLLESDIYGNRIWNLTSLGSVVASFRPTGVTGSLCTLAYAREIPGGPYLFIGDWPQAPEWSTIYALKADTASLMYSFRAPITFAGPGVADLGWDGQYLWLLENGPGAETGWVRRFVAWTAPAVAPASLGKIKALYR